MGCLIAPEWIVTVAHTIFYDYVGKSLVIGTDPYVIQRVHIHSGYKQPKQDLFQGDASALIDFLRSRDDIALIKLERPVSGIEPLALYAGEDEKGKVITVYGKGATGNGLTGEEPETKSRRQLNRFENVIEGSTGRWLKYRFDSPPDALALEGMHGSGDSGSGAVIMVDNKPYLVGLSSWQGWQGDLADFKGGLYGATAYQVRVSHYIDWINQIKSADSDLDNESNE